MLAFIRLITKIGIPIILGCIISLYLLPSKDSYLFKCKDTSSIRVKKEFIDVAKDWTVKVKKSNISMHNNANKGKVVRSRFIATELGIREKLLVIILGQSSLSVALNNSIAEHVPRLHVFADASRIDSDMNTLENLSPYKPNGQHAHIHILNGIFNMSFHENFDWFFLLPDTTYINPFELMRLVNSINWNNPIAIGMSDKEGKCILDAGILLSNPTMQSLIQQRHICNSVTALSDTVALEMCIHHATNLSCVQNYQNKKFRWWKVEENNAPDSSLHESISNLSLKKNFNNSLTISPLLSDLDAQSLHNHFVKVEIDYMEKEINELSNTIEKLAFEDGTPTWPVGISGFTKPPNRYLSPTWEYFTESYIFKNNPAVNKLPLENDDLLDIQEIISSARKFIEKEFKIVSDFEGEILDHLVSFDHEENQKFTSLLEGEYDPSRVSFSGLLQGYRMFNAQRGMDYIVDLNYSFSTNNGDEIIPIRVRLIRPIHRTQLLNQVPYVKEDTDLTVVISVENQLEIEGAIKILNKHASFCSIPGFDENRKTLIVIAARGLTSNFFDEITESMKFLRNKCKQVLTDAVIVSLKDSDTMIQIAAMNEVVDRYGQQMVYLLLSPYADYSKEFMDRVRINTIKHFQVFFPIPFAQFNPLVVNADKIINKLMSEQEKIQDSFKQESKRDDLSLNLHVDNEELIKKILEINELYPLTDNTKEIIVHKDFGFFDTNDFSCLSMYGSDYLSVRKYINDKQNMYDLSTLFIGLEEIHLLRTIEPSLKIRSYIRECSTSFSKQDYEKCSASKKMSYGSKAQLANVVFTDINELKSRVHLFL
uniref:Hexosyltransferase n=1 Tax=Parastrongyloides trichosuri TaxID=131310 RepID=A0A0N4ZI91_PARTI